MPSLSLAEFIASHPRLVVLTGAGLSAAAGIPTYRDHAGVWRRSDPIQHQQFINEASARQRYWCRSMVGWRMLTQSSPTPAHQALADLEKLGHIELLVTQNVDRLHQGAGQKNTVDLHGRMDKLSCLKCQAQLDRADFQAELEGANPDLSEILAEALPDGDADVADDLVTQCKVPQCLKCGGTLMPDVVFFGGTVPRERVSKVTGAIQKSDALLCVGSSLKVFSGFRFCRQARECDKPVAIVNAGVTRADDMAQFKWTEDCQTLLPNAVVQLSNSGIAVRRSG